MALITGGSSSLRSVFRSLKYRNFRLFFGGQSLSLIGTWIQRIATSWLVYHLTGSTIMLGLVGFAGQIPTFLLAPFGGVASDRWNRYHLLILTQVLAMVQAALLAVLILIGRIEVWQVIVLSIFLGIINAFDVPIRQAFFIQMIENKEDLGNAIAINSSMVNSARLIGPAVAGVLISVTGEGVCFLINAISFVFVIISLLMMKIPPRVKVQRQSHMFREMKAGFQYAFGFLPIRYIILLLALVSLMGMPYSVLMPVMAKEVLHGDSHTFGFLMAASGLGALTGAYYLASRKSVAGLSKIIPLSAAVFGIGLIAFSFSRSFIISLILMVFTGLGMMMQMAASNTVLQTIVDDDKRGRVMSFYTMAFMGIAPFGSMLAGGLAKAIGAPYTIFAGGISCIAGAMAFAIKLPKINIISDTQSGPPASDADR
jgi:MFS family permease